MRECYECRENDKNFKTSIHYKCTNSNCENFIAPLEISACGWYNSACGRGVVGGLCPLLGVRKGAMPPTRLKQQSIKSYLIGRPLL